jgi:large subunit ribosomal protein L28
MSKKCELTGKSPLKGHKVSHANNKLKRKFFPNLKNVTFKSDILRRNIRLNVSNAALKTVDYKGGLDYFLKTVKTYKLSKRAKRLKNQIIEKT